MKTFGALDEPHESLCARRCRHSGKVFYEAGITTLFAMSAALWAQDAPFQMTRTNATIEGTHGFTVTGTSPSAPAPGSPVETIVGVPITTFDGYGKFTQKDNIHGSITGFPAPDRQGTGSGNPNLRCGGECTHCGLAVSRRLFVHFVRTAL